MPVLDVHYHCFGQLYAIAGQQRQMYGVHMSVVQDDTPT